MGMRSTKQSPECICILKLPIVATVLRSRVLINLTMKGQRAIIKKYIGLVCVWLFPVGSRPLRLPCFLPFFTYLFCFALTCSSLLRLIFDAIWQCLVSNWRLVKKLFITFMYIHRILVISSGEKEEKPIQANLQKEKDLASWGPFDNLQPRKCQMRILVR